MKYNMDPNSLAFPGGYHAQVQCKPLGSLHNWP